MEIVFYLVICVVIGMAGMHMADTRGRSKVGGFGMGFLLGLIGLAVIAIMGHANTKESKDE